MAKPLPSPKKEPRDPRPGQSGSATRAPTSDSLLVAANSGAGEGSSVPPGSWPLWSRLLAGLMLLWHLTAQVLATWTGAPPVSPLGIQLAEPFRPYITAANLDQGYRFFAPDPGPSHLFQFEVFDGAGGVVPLDEIVALDETRLTGQYPPPGLRVGLFSGMPRLLYHRYFMLTEQILPYLPTPDVPEPDRSAQLNRFRAVANSYAQEILRRNGGARVRMRYLRHEFPDPNAVAELLNSRRTEDPLRDPRSYQELWSGEFMREAVPVEPALPAKSLPNSTPAAGEVIAPGK